MLNSNIHYWYLSLSDNKLWERCSCCSVCGCGNKTDGFSSGTIVGNSKGVESGGSRCGRHCIVGDQRGFQCCCHCKHTPTRPRPQQGQRWRRCSQHWTSPRVWWLLIPVMFRVYIMFLIMIIYLILLSVTHLQYWYHNYYLLWVSTIFAPGIFVRSHK